MNYYELSAFILYFIAMIAIGIYFFIISKDTSEKSYFLGGRNMNGIVPLYYNMGKAKPTELNNKNIYAGLSAAFTGGNIGIYSKLFKLLITNILLYFIF